MVAILGANSVSGEYEVSNSLRFNDDDSPNLTVAQSTPTDGSRWTWSGWVKRGNLSDGSSAETFASSYNGSNTDRIQFTEDDELHVEFKNGSSTVLELHTTQLFRDTSAWYHIVVAFDSNLSQSNRVKIYVNGIQVTSFSTSSELSTSGYTTKGFNANSKNFVHGAYEGSSLLNYYDGYLTEVNFVDGSAKAQTDFGEFDDNGVWIPKQYTGTYGNNGFFLEFKQTGTSQNSSGIGADTSGNDNHFAVTNLASTDITEDTCTNNFCTFTPIDTPETNPTLSEGNVKLATQASPAYTFDVASFGLQQGKWYWEIKCSGAYDDDYHMVGIASTQPTAHNQELGYFTNDYGLYGGGGVNSLRYGATFYSYGNAINNNDIVGVALDLDNNRLYFSINGTFQNSSDPANGTNPISITDPSSTDRGFYFPAVCFLDGSNSATYEGNWGNPSFSISSGNNDGLYGNFEYSVPSGYYALCTKRLAEFG